MRLSTQEIDSIKTIVQEFDPEAHIFLHGSRIDDDLKGGDIDLFVVCSNEKINEIRLKKHYLSSQLSLALRQQRIDVTLLSAAETLTNIFFLQSKMIKIH
jgi:uncharacterized protein